jgi:hypothetical protein
MALLFPISASIGQTYQSGSSNTYEWTGTYWKIKNVINFNAFSASIVNRINAATNEQDLSYLATTGSNLFKGSQTISGSILVSGSIVPSTGNGTYTSSFSLGSPTNAWKDLYISQGSIVFVNAVTRATSSFSISTDDNIGENTVQYTAGITASYYLGDGRGLTNLPSTTNWNKDKGYILRNTEQLTFSGDYMLENSLLAIEGGSNNSIGEWVNENVQGDGTITRTGNNTYRIDGPNDSNDNGGWLFIKRYFDTPTTMSIGYEWNRQDAETEDWPMYDVVSEEPTGEISNANRLDDNNANYETGTWTINVPENNWLAIGVYSTDSCCGSGSLHLTLPYLFGDDVQYAPNKYFKKEGTIFIGGNLLLKDSTIINNGKISVGGEVILIGDSLIQGTGTII